MITLQQLLEIAQDAGWRADEVQVALLTQGDDEETYELDMPAMARTRAGRPVLVVQPGARLTEVPDYDG